MSNLIFGQKVTTTNSTTLFKNHGKFIQLKSLGLLNNQTTIGWLSIWLSRFFAPPQKPTIRNLHVWQKHSAKEENPYTPNKFDVMSAILAVVNCN